MRTLFLLLLTCLPCFAQFGVEQPIFATPLLSSQSITNDGALAYYWNYNDLTNGTVVAWPDRKQNLTWLRYNTSFGPVKDASGAWFTNKEFFTTLLTNTGVAYATNCVMGLIWKPVLSSGTYNSFLDHTNAAFWTLTKWSGNLCYLDIGAPGVTWAAWLNSTARQFTLMTWSNTIFSVWTNKIDGTGYALSKSGSSAGWTFPGINRLGAATAQLYVNAYQGSFQEIAIWTNITDPQRILTNYWSYATNTYAFP